MTYFFPDREPKDRLMDIQVSDKFLKSTPAESSLPGITDLSNASQLDKHSAVDTLSTNIYERIKADPELAENEETLKHLALLSDGLQEFSHQALASEHYALMAQVYEIALDKIKRWGL